MSKTADSFTFTVGKLDAGMAILLGERAHLIEFPSILLPPGATTGSIVNIAVHQNVTEEKKRDEEFWSLQDAILEEFGKVVPKAPELEVRNVTQTSVTLSWSPLQLATSKLRSLDIYRNGQRLAAIPSPLTNTSTKLSGLELDTPYTFQLILRTTAGTFPSNTLNITTHTTSNTSGVVVCFGPIMDEEREEEVKRALSEMGGRWSEKIEIDTSHYVCDTPRLADGMLPPVGSDAPGANGGGGVAKAVAGYKQVLGVEYQRALQLSIPTVQPSWVMECWAQKRMVPVAGHYLGTQPPTSTSTASFSSHPNKTQSLSHVNLNQQQQQHPGQHPHAGSSVNVSQNPSSGAGAGAGTKQNRQSMPAVPSNYNRGGNESPFVNQSERFERTVEDVEGEAQAQTQQPASQPQTPGELGPDETSRAEKRKSTPGMMNRDFRFPPQPPSVSPTQPGSGSGSASGAGSVTMGVPSVVVTESTPTSAAPTTTAGSGTGMGTITPTSIEVPPPPPVEKESSLSARGRDAAGEESDEGDVGDVVEVDLS
jgi:hypothetical protein